MTRQEAEEFRARMDEPPDDLVNEIMKDALHMAREYAKRGKVSFTLSRSSSG